MNKRDFNVVGNEGTDNQELAKGIAFVKSRRAELNVVQMVENMRDQAMPNGVIINDAYCDRSRTRDYDREGLNAFFATLKEEDFEVVVVRSLNEITDDIYDLEEFVKTITDMGIWLYIHEFVKRKEYSIVGKIRRNGFSQRDVDRQWNQIVNMIRKKQISGIVVANMAAISSSVADAYFKVGLVIEAGGIVVTVDEGRLDMHIKKGA